MTLPELERARSRGGAEPIPRLRDGVDLMKAGLSMDEGIVASRIDGRTTVPQLALLVGKPKAELERILERLRSAGVVTLGGGEAETPAERAGPKSSPAAPTPSSSPGQPAERPKLQPDPDFEIPPALLAEKADLTEEERRRIFFFFVNLEEWTHYELLQVKRKDDAKAIKRAYYERSKEWHPDRFRRPELGSFKRMIDAIFKQVQEAYHLLSDPAKRAVYDRDNILMFDEDTVNELLAQQRREDREERRIQEALDRRRRRNPLRQRLDQARRFYEEALELKEKGETLEALRAAQMAAAFENREEYTALAESLKGVAGEFRIGPLMRRGLAQESMTNWSDAIMVFQEAVRIAPEYGPARLRLAFNQLMGGRDPHEANAHAQKAATLLPDDPEAHFVLGICYEKGGMEKAAIRAFARAVELKPNYAEAKKRLKKLKWGF